MISNPFTDPKWANKTVDIIDRCVGFVRNKTTKPFANLLRAIVFGIIATVAGFVVFVLGLIGLARGLQELLDIWLTRPNAVWISYFVLAILFSGTGAMMMRKRHASTNNSDKK